MTISRAIIIGTGNMGAALLKGIHSQLPAIELVGVDQHLEKINNLATDIPGLAITSDPIQGIARRKSTRNRGAKDAIFLCIKPQDLDRLSGLLAGKLNAADNILVTLLAGVTIAEIATALKFKGPVIRAMPNIAAMVAAAATGMASNDAATDQDKDDVAAVFKAVGRAVWVKENQLDAVTGLSGSGPAFIYIVIEALTDGGVKMGLPRDVAATLATQTVFGSAALVQATGLHPAVLRDQVTTPGGTTISGIHELESHGIRAMMISAVAIATERAHTLRKARTGSKD